MYTQKLLEIMQTYEPFMKDLRLVQQLGLPQWCISAGYIRNYVWDYLHGYKRRTPLNDVDIIYYDKTSLDEESEKSAETYLYQQVNEYQWSVKNQARMHLRNHDAPYTSISDAMKRWPETATAIGIRLDQNDRLEIIAPFGLNDLFDLKVRRSPYFLDEDDFTSRFQSKRWLEQWPMLQIVRESEK